MALNTLPKNSADAAYLKIHLQNLINNYVNISQHN